MVRFFSLLASGSRLRALLADRLGVLLISSISGAKSIDSRYARGPHTTA